MAKLDRETKYTLELTEDEAMYLYALCSEDTGHTNEGKTLYQVLSEEVSDANPFESISDSCITIIKRGTNEG